MHLLMERILEAALARRPKKFNFTASKSGLYPEKITFRWAIGAEKKGCKNTHYAT
jgi:hypothetical protein